jgi:DNA-binding LytR/AlgR family response regulator
MKYKYLVVDDEPLARKLIQDHASKIEGLQFIGECSNPFEASNLLRTVSVDILFLDIQMPEMTGLQLLQTIKHKPAVILTTAFRNYAPEAFDLEVVDYLLKPISFERLLRSVNKFFDQQKNESVSNAAVVPAGPRYVHVKSDRKIHKIAEEEILYIESLDDYVKVHMPDKILITYENISAFESRLSNPRFVRIHRSFLINANHAVIISGEGVTIGKKELPFGRAFKKSAISQLEIKQLK